MQKLTWLIVAIMMSASNLAHADDELSTGDRILLLASMQQSIERHLVDGKFFYFDTDGASVSSLYPAKAHPMILSLGEHYILCADFRDEDGASVNVDFYATREGDAFVIFDKVIGNREPIQRLMAAGLAHVVH